MKQWTIDKVAAELRKLLDEAVVAKFIEQVGYSMCFSMSVRFYM
ncbi:unnamed protein product [Cylicostephanus goldi]|uniref:Uncharacterized protein n=1 Tax=Cylicostephanus goldi TaxID=71465 RepID=A0A3P7Q8J1_CYLGO|nr:unnamed protein product [Cylicostephanus goldi]